MKICLDQQSFWTERIVQKLIFSIFILTVSNSIFGANQFDLGVAKGSALKMAIWLDRHEATCKKNAGHKWENQVDFLLHSTWGHGTEEIFKNTAMQMKMPIDQVKNYPAQEFDGIKNEYGGCKSTRYKKFIAGVYRDYLDTIRMLTDKEWWSGK